jgi:hypothetical protein
MGRTVSTVSRLSKLSNERFRETDRAESIVRKRDSRTCAAAVRPSALIRVLCRTSTPLSESESPGEDDTDDRIRCNSLRLKLKLLRRKQGAPGPPNRIKAPLLTLCGTTIPVDSPSQDDEEADMAGEGIRTPFTNVP